MPGTLTLKEHTCTIDARTAEDLRFEHNCTAAPCAVTQMLFASVYPTHGAPFDWQHATISLYIDGEATASVQFTAPEAAEDEYLVRVHGTALRGRGDISYVGVHSGS